MAPLRAVSLTPSSLFKAHQASPSECSGVPTAHDRCTLARPTPSQRALHALLRDARHPSNVARERVVTAVLAGTCATLMGTTPDHVEKLGRWALNVVEWLGEGGVHTKASKNPDHV